MVPKYRGRYDKTETNLVAWLDGVKRKVKKGGTSPQVTKPNTVLAHTTVVKRPNISTIIRPSQ